ncbi:G2/mitotic-specific cyclin-B3 isoform X2 [Desmodus rotundus]|uniref:G2/mitotic-specific cyclin-B3 isoform X2 n=1 Tax=Desmodus rotundus TaxID=9430 RepID=UPI002380CE20|nr:G2/mitotic-specific cyclin-B3 isoform X2 [Desmodus rotundus]
MPLPLPLPLGSSKHETKKSQFSKIVPSDHGQSEKRGEKYQAKISSSSPQGPLKKRSALEDLTNASQSQPAQTKKEASKEFVKDVSKKINRTKPTLELSKNNEMNIKQYELEPPSTAVSTPMVLHIVKKPRTLKTSAISETPTTEDPSLIKKPLVLKEKPTTGNTVLNRRSLKKHINQNTISVFEKPLTLLEETESDLEYILEPVTFGKKQKAEEAVVTQKNLSFKEICTREGKQSCCEEEMTLLNVNVEKDSFFMEPMNFRKKPETEEATPTKRLLTLNKCATQEKMSHEKRPLILQKATFGEESLIEKPLSFKKKCTTEEFDFQESSPLQEKHTTQGEVSILKKPLTLQKRSAKEESLLKETLFFKKKRPNEEATATMEIVILKKKCTTQDKIPCLKTISEAKSAIKEPLSFEKKPTTEEKFLFKESSVLPEKHTTQGEVSILKKPLVLQKTPTEEESLLKDTPVFKKKRTIEEATATKELVVLKKKCTTQDKIPCLKKPLVLQTISEGKSVIKESSSFKNKPATEKEFLFKESSVLPEKHTTQGEVALLKKPWALQENIHSKDEFLMEPVSFRKKHTMSEAISSKELISLKKKECTTQIMMSICQVILDMQNIIDKGKDPFFMGPASFRKKSSIEEAGLTKTPLSAKRKRLTQEKMFLLEKPLVLDETTPEKGSLCKKALHFKKKPKTDKEFVWQDPSLLKEDHTTLQGLFHSKKPLALQEKPSIEKESLFKELAFHGKSTINEAFHFKMCSLNEKPTTEQELSFEEPLALQNNSTHREDTFIKDASIQVESSPHVFSTAPESRTGMSSSGIVSSVSKFNATKKYSACESSSNKPFSSRVKRSWKEKKFILKKYMRYQSDISSNMRAILVNWLVAVQITFKVSHETLYLAVKLVDHYLMKVMCKKDKLQLLGSTAFMIAAKFEESYPPHLNDFLYLCNDTYQREEMLAMEISILKTLEFDINIPVAYHFLRRYSVCFRVNMNTLLLSRFICEMTLLEYDYIQERASKLAAGSFLLALYMKNLGHLAPTLEYYSGYKTSDLHPLVKKLNVLLTLRSCDNRHKIVPSKYSHRLFFEVTKIPPLNMWNLEEILNSC